ncbi:fluoride efflux transporter CrcB [Lentibacillus saliphilus]|uniref:fluoride efflux transporter CrcB n=1 Tax=Lentibacillus saliphilus TaxID=2737028 RepID=UPI001C30F877|nr:fluoride efflux transporter CrcB [Lentibacillus saliphilus]
MNKLVCVMIGGFVGSILRYYASVIVISEGFPWPTLAVNLIGCFLLAWLLTTAVVKKTIHPNVSLLLGTGLLGSFTTFSTFSLETVRMIDMGHIGLAVIYVSVSIFIGLLLAYTGVNVALRNGGESK